MEITEAITSKRFLVRLSYLGFRYHGLQKQLQFMTIEERVEIELKKYFGDKALRIRFSSRTDSLVSARGIYLLIMFQDHEEELKDVAHSLDQLPNDIKVLDIKAVDNYYVLDHNIVEEEYHYYFTFKQDNFDPFSAPFFSNIKENLNIELMKEAAALFVGQHYFKNFSFRITPDSVLKRQILSAEITENKSISGTFMPEISYVFKVRSQGFLRGQVRAMMGALFLVGRNEMSLNDLKNLLSDSEGRNPQWRMPAAGLVLYNTVLKPL